MKGKLTFMAGFGTGFVLGSKQGREPYEKLQAWWMGRMEGKGHSRDLRRAADHTTPDAFGEGLIVVEAEQVGHTTQPGTEMPRVAGPSDSDLWTDTAPRVR